MAERLKEGRDKRHKPAVKIRVGRMSDGLSKKEHGVIRERVKVAELDLWDGGYKNRRVVGHVMADPTRPVERVSISEARRLRVLGRMTDVEYECSTTPYESDKDIKLLTLTLAPATKRREAQEISFDFTKDPIEEVARVATLLTVEGQEDTGLEARAAVVCDLLEGTAQAWLKAK